MYVYGKNQVVELLKSTPQRVEKVFISRKTHLPLELLRLLETLNTPVIHVDNEKIERMVGNDRHQGVVAVVREMEFSSLAEVVDKTVTKRGILLVCDHIKDPQNLGNIIRSCDALGATGVVIPAMKAAGFTEAVIKASAGAVFNIHICVVENLASFLREIKKRDIWVYVLERGGKCLYDAVYNFPMALVVGSEDEGVGEGIKKTSDEIVSIPMVGKINSLNAASSAAIALSWILYIKGADNGEKVFHS
ncbi:MAG TPA: 23S rRNA (guanosine(2251)-2'-O)-methyltransferase RlmB [Candidatus Hydrothermia bacterium]|nr:23S rRNA (guanosine(2251)-2'-O)-methyltransferase RlmB [Candidatus Hydrothermae bacterium]MDD3649732.1 23S rRNA (guanosine(2251)-2'-O)-methyltransferase RlmB [Candidatus Hydrothermia bacterium]MDD5572657.1 23S rRNA (guanosine(2251)-2'-O)-methyltransferase RlmB [Candidatus Hydrothermia bacterium]HOK23646.1 23S rRNA (guanosine(2251)-2'-O)-methyltransferase RlmB [Candidatus Hydrothermia bacterium]HOL24373.1 23S rRNA (guanosine(2251)-2'-O)-methyltransferase RlmB [Candidatus Hydrothermia bacteriu